MKILLIDVNCKNSSTGKIVYDLYQGINKETNCEAAICYGRGPLIKEKNIYKFGIDLETNIHAFLTRISGLTGCFSFFSTRRLIKYINEFKPDIIHIHELHAYFVNIKSLIEFLKKKNIPIIWTFHCEFMYTGKCGVSYECQQYITGCGKCPHLEKYPKVLFFDFTHYMWKQKKTLLQYYNNIIIITPSQWLADKVKQSFLRTKNIKIIHNGIDTSIFNKCATKEELKKELKIKENKIILSVASHITSDSNKGAHYIYQLAKEFINLGVHFILVGADEKSIIRKENITIIPTIKDQKKLARIYSGADAFLICSKKENFPTTLIEAQCCGLPVCGFDVGGIKETIISNSYLCQFGDIQMLKKNLIKAMNDVYDASYALHFFSKSRMLDEYFKLYRYWDKVGKKNGE